MRTAIERRGVAVVVIPGDVVPCDRRRGRPQPAGAPARATRSSARPTRSSTRAAERAERARSASRSCAGAGCAGAHDELVALAGALQAPVVHALRGKEYVEYDNPYDVGMTGLLGFALRLPRHGALRRAAHARHRLPLPPVLSRGRHGRPGRHPRRAASAAACRSTSPLVGDGQGHGRRRCCRGSQPKTRRASTWSG